MEMSHVYIEDLGHNRYTDAHSDVDNRIDRWTCGRASIET